MSGIRSHGGGIRLANSNGDYEVGFTTDNPQWKVWDENGNHQLYRGDGYFRWTYVEFTFDWKNDTYTVYVKDLSTGHTERFSGTLRHGVDVQTLYIDDYSGGSWGGTGQRESFGMWFDDIRFEQ